MVDEIRRATNGNYVLGNEGFAAQVTAAFGRRGTRKIGATTSDAGVRVGGIV